MRLPYVVWGFLLAPTFAWLMFLWKAWCPTSPSGVCLADYFSIPIFLPLITVYKVFGPNAIASNHELLLILLYWSAVGFLVGLILDLYIRWSEYLHEQHPPL